MKFILLLFFAMAFAVVTKADTTKPPSCTTPDQKTGECIDVYKCPHILAYAREKPPKHGKFIGDSVCKGHPKEISVCCGPDPKLNEKA